MNFLGVLAKEYACDVACPSENLIMVVSVEKLNGKAPKEAVKSSLSAK
jgi:hypothetical protein